MTVFGVPVPIPFLGSSEYSGATAELVCVEDVPVFWDVAVLFVATDALLEEGIPCRASLKACMSEGLCRSTEKPCFWRNKSELGISALYIILLSH